MDDTDNPNNRPTDVKITVVGESGVGKSSLSQRIVYDNFPLEGKITIGAAYLVIKKIKSGYTYKLNFWDTAGQEKYKSLVPMYIKGANIVLLVFDITNRNSLMEIKKSWYEYSMKYAELSTKILVGTKTDLDTRTVTSEEALEFALFRNMKYVECSAKMNFNVDKIVEIILGSISPVLPPNIPLKLDEDSEDEVDKKIETCMGGNRCYTY